MKLIALIPAREGSKRIPKKNFMYLGTKPLISYTIEAAMQVNLFDKIIISSDYADCAEIVDHYKESDPRLEFHYRIKQYAGDFSSDHEWIKYTFDHYGWDMCTHYVILRPTNPFRTHKTILRALIEFNETAKERSLKSVQPVSEYPGKMWVECEGEVNKFFPYEHMIAQTRPASFEEQSSNFKAIYVQNGCIDICPIKIIREWRTRYIGNMIYPFFTRDLEGYDINTIDDWAYAEYLLRKNERDIVN